MHAKEEDTCAILTGDFIILGLTALGKAVNTMVVLCFCALYHTLSSTRDILQWSWVQCTYIRYRGTVLWLEKTAFLATYVWWNRQTTKIDKEIWDHSEFYWEILWHHFCIFLGTAAYAAVLSNQASLLILILFVTNPTCKHTLTGWGSRVYPNDWGSRVYPNDQGSQVCPHNQGSRVHPRGSQVYPNGWGSRARPGWGRRCVWALPSRFTLRAHGLGFTLTTITRIHLFCTAKNQ